MTDDGPVRIAMWSGPRNISTTMMRSFGNRPDTSVTDEPFYAAYLAATGYDHPMGDAVLASQPNDWETVARSLVGPVPDGRPVWYQKHMAHHMLPRFGRGWIDRLTNVFLIRAPEAVLASYTERRSSVTLAEIGLPAQVEMFDRVADRTGAAPLVLEAQDVLRDPAGMLAALCRGCGIAFDPAMLRWPEGRRVTDGVWAPVWYDKVEKSTGFGPVRQEIGCDRLDVTLQRIAAEARPLYERLAAVRLRTA